MITARKKITVSVVDDDESVRRMISRVIESEGLKVTAYNSAEEFLGGGPDDSACLILDVHLPGISGVDLQEHLHRADRPIPIIFVSADADERTRERVLRAGAAGFLGKPFSVSSLLNAVRATVKGRPCSLPTPVRA